MRPLTCQDARTVVWDFSIHAPQHGDPPAFDDPDRAGLILQHSVRLSTCRISVVERLGIFAACE